MYLEAVQEIRKIEEQMEQAKAQARQQAQDALSAAEKEGKALLASARREIRDKDAAEMAKCDAAAAEQRDAVLRKTEADCQELRRQAEAHMEEAAALIVGKVVGR